MKRLFIILLTIYAHTSIAQAIYSDTAFLKATNNLWSASVSLKDAEDMQHTIAATDNPNLSRLTKSILTRCLEGIKKNITTAKHYYRIIEAKYPNEGKITYGLASDIGRLENCFTGIKDHTLDEKGINGRLIIVETNLAGYIENKLK